MGESETLTHRSVLKMAVPIMLAGLSTPLLGLVDIAVVGQIPGAESIGAVAVAALIFSFVFWAFGFLRMGTTGLTAQAFGANRRAEIGASLGRALMLAWGTGLMLCVLGQPIKALALWIFDAAPLVETLVADYFDIRIWSAPATLTHYALIGWFVGLGRMRTALALQLVLNLTNIFLDAWFVLVLKWGVTGVATGTLIAEWMAAGIGLVTAARCMRAQKYFCSGADLLKPAAFRRVVQINGDIMVRSLALIFVFAWFTQAGAKAGAGVLAANAILLQFVSVAAYFLDGFAHTAETLVGRAIGARSHAMFSRAVQVTTLLAAYTAVLCGVVIYFGSFSFIAMMTIDPETRILASRFVIWAALAPVLGVWAYQLDGLFIGATRSVEMRNAMLLSTAGFVVAWWLLLPFGNHGLWAALMINYVLRAAALMAFLPRLLRDVRRYPTVSADSF
ncbi:MAG: MATE family efflux transporter [Gammaproteobacteria bacterium]